MPQKGKRSTGFEPNGNYSPTMEYVELVNRYIKADLDLKDLASIIGVSKTNMTQWGQGKRPGLTIEEWFSHPANREELRVISRAVSKGMITKKEALWRMERTFNAVVSEDLI